jgi:hypothetical protein
MKMRMLTAASILLAVVLIATISHAAPSCCDPKNTSTPGATLAPGQPTMRTIPGPSIQQRLVAPQPAPGIVRATGSNWGGPVSQRPLAAAKPVGFLNAPAAPSCCALPNNTGQARAINPATQVSARGCGCCGSTGAQAQYSGFQPPRGQVQFTSNPPSTGQPVNPVGQASCCQPTGPGLNQGGWNASQRTGFPGLW